MVTPPGCPRPASLRRAVVLVDVIVGTVILGVALAVMVGILGRSLASQVQGEQLETAASLIDEQLNLVLMRGPDSYASRYGLEGVCDPPMDRFRYRLTFTSPPAGRPYEVTATVFWEASGRERSASASTLIAPRLGNDPDPIRRPDQVVERDPS